MKGVVVRRTEAERLISRLVAWCCAALLLASGIAVAAEAAEAGLRRAPPQPVDAGARVIVKYRDSADVGRTRALSAGAAGTGPSGAAQLSVRHGLSLSDGRALNSRTQVLHATGIGSAALVARLAADADIEWVVEDKRRFALAAPNDPLYGDNLIGVTPVVGQWYLRAPTSVRVSSIDIEPAWVVTQGLASMVVAVLDTGVRFDHPDLQGRLLPGYDFVSTVAAANDGDGYDSDASDPGDWITAGENVSGGAFPGCGVSSSSWHGTQTAGLVGAAASNGIGMAGTAPDVKVLPVRVLGKCGGFDSDIVVAMRWAAGLDVGNSVPINPNPAKVLNLSLGSSGSCTPLYRDAVNELIGRGVVIVAAAGNEGLAVNTPGNCDGVIAVAGVRHAGTKVGYSSLGAEVALAAPAGNCVNPSGDCLYPILSTSNAGTNSPGAATYTDSIDYAVGTSFSSPLVAGTAALMLSANPSLTPAQVKTLLQDTARPFVTSGAGTNVAACQVSSVFVQDECYCTSTTCGAGMLDAGAAVRRANSASGSLATISLSSTTVAPGETLSLDSSASQPTLGATIVQRSWSLTSGAGLAQLVVLTDGVTASLRADSLGSVTVQLSVTDSLGSTSVTSQVVTIGTATGTTSGDSGGGALGPLWFLGLLLAIAALAGRPRRAD